MTGASGAELIIHNCSAENSDRKCQNVVTISSAACIGEPHAALVIQADARPPARATGDSTGCARLRVNEPVAELARVWSWRSAKVWRLRLLVT